MSWSNVDQGYEYVRNQMFFLALHSTDAISNISQFNTLLLCTLSFPICLSFPVLLLLLPTCTAPTIPTIMSNLLVNPIFGLLQLLHFITSPAVQVLAVIAVVGCFWGAEDHGWAGAEAAFEVLDHYWWHSGGWFGMVLGDGVG